MKNKIKSLRTKNKRSRTMAIVHVEMLDKQFINEGKFLVYGDDILYPLSEGDRSLAYFGTITLA